MQEHTFWETIKVQGSELLDAVKKIIHEGNVRRVRIKQGDRVVAEFPLTAGVVGTVFAPVLAAVGALAALLTECSIDVERVHQQPAAAPPKPPEAQTL
jgi:D-aminopeptidase